MKKDKATGGIRLRLMNYVLGGLTLGIAVLMLVTTFLAISGYNSPFISRPSCIVITNTGFCAMFPPPLLLRRTCRPFFHQNEPILTAFCVSCKFSFVFFVRFPRTL